MAHEAARVSGTVLVSAVVQLFSCRADFCEIASVFTLFSQDIHLGQISCRDSFLYHSTVLLELGHLVFLPLLFLTSAKYFQIINIISKDTAALDHFSLYLKCFLFLQEF